MNAGYRNESGSNLNLLRQSLDTAPTPAGRSACEFLRAAIPLLDSHLISSPSLLPDIISLLDAPTFMGAAAESEIRFPEYSDVRRRFLADLLPTVFGIPANVPTTDRYAWVVSILRSLPPARAVRFAASCSESGVFGESGAALEFPPLPNLSEIQTLPGQISAVFEHFLAALARHAVEKKKAPQDVYAVLYSAVSGRQSEWKTPTCTITLDDSGLYRPGIPSRAADPDAVAYVLAMLRGSDKQLFERGVLVLLERRSLIDGTMTNVSAFVRAPDLVWRKCRDGQTREFLRCETAGLPGHVVTALGGKSVEHRGAPLLVSTSRISASIRGFVLPHPTRLAHATPPPEKAVAPSPDSELEDPDSTGHDITSATYATVKPWFDDDDEPVRVKDRAPMRDENASSRVTGGTSASDHVMNRDPVPLPTKGPRTEPTDDNEQPVERFGSHSLGRKPRVSDEELQRLKRLQQPSSPPSVPPDKSAPESPLRSAWAWGTNRGGSYKARE